MIGATGMRRMIAKPGDGALQGFISEILSLAEARFRKPSLRETEQSLRSTAERDYGAALRKHFDRRQFVELLSDMRAVLPTLNREVFRITDLRRLGKIADNMGVLLKADVFKGSNGRELRGFYVPDRQFLKRPLICVNTANHPVAVAAAFWHEIGHHLTTELFGEQHAETMNLSYLSGYADHLNDPREIAADLVMALACYPKPDAERLFGSSPRKLLNGDPDRLVSRVVPHVRTVTGFDFENGFSARENLHYLAGIIHLAKLRSALFREYRI
jgi:hypothetical protein